MVQASSGKRHGDSASRRGHQATNWFSSAMDCKDQRALLNGEDIRRGREDGLLQASGFLVPGCGLVDYEFSQHVPTAYIWSCQALPLCSQIWWRLAMSFFTNFSCLEFSSCSRT
uniref:Uncharacterized protein n=1 Tax=Oryza meridionalis TaxID=40149 RepID=A0A0E0C3Z6_9ORYZ